MNKKSSNRQQTGQDFFTFLSRYQKKKKCIAASWKIRQWCQPMAFQIIGLKNDEKKNGRKWGRKTRYYPLSYAMRIWMRAVYMFVFIFYAFKLPVGII